jgi:hypothetical protein
MLKGNPIPVNFHGLNAATTNNDDATLTGDQREPPRIEVLGNGDSREDSPFRSGFPREGIFM